MAGAVAGGFVLLPWLHLRGAVQAAAWLELGGGFAALLLARAVVRGRVRAASWPAAACAVLAGVTLLVPAWNPLLMSSGMFLYASRLENGSRAAVIEAAIHPYELLFYDEGLSSIVTVARGRETGNIWLAHNGKVDASSHHDLDTQVLLAHLPMLFRPDADRVMVLGLASGMTAGSIALHPAPRQIDLVEIEPLVIDALEFFNDYNHRPLDDPRTRVWLNDARNHLLRMPDGSYDVVTAEPSNPWLSGVASLFTRDFFELGRRKLAKGGVWAQWLHSYGMGWDDLRSLLATFASVYDHVRVFSVGDSDLILVGSAEPLPLDTDRIRRALVGREAVQDDLILAGIRSPVDVLLRYQFDRDAIVSLTQGVELNTDDNMRIEYAAPLRMHEDTMRQNRALLASAAEVPIDATHQLEELVALAGRYGDEGDWERALLAIRAAEKRNPSVAEISRVLHELARKAERPEPASGE
ncbi:MAG: hypothetical protein JRG82_07595 [Deltaproteobacteria bacterium]|nr:hypothetical protein [Deltaproteobacteria bacterium]